MKKYYAEREHMSINSDFTNIRHLFLRIYRQFFYDEWFAKAKFDWAISDPVLYLYQKLGLINIWPFGKKIETYDETTLFTVIEFLYEHTYYNAIYERDYVNIKFGQKEYRNKVNEILRFYNGGYKLSEDGKIQKLSLLGFEGLTEIDIETNDPKNIDLKIKYATSRYFYYNSSIEDKEAALLKLSGVLEFLQKRGIKLPTNDDNDLFQIMNEFNLRHKNRKQHSQYKEEVWYDWMFYTFLASIHVLLKLNDERFDLKIKQAE